MQVTFQGEPMEIKGTPLSVGDRVPNVTLQAINLDEVPLSNFINEKPVVLSVVPDVQTRTCELQTKAFADKLADQDVIYLTVSRNTVEEFRKWGEENDLDLVTLSDHKGEFGREFGLNFDLGGDERLARSVFLVGTDSVIKYVQVVEEVADEPNYDEVLEAIRTNSL